MPAALSTDERYDRVMARREQRASTAYAAPTAPTAATAAPTIAPPVSVTVPGEATRRRRNVFNGTEPKLGVRSQIPGYHLRIFTDSNSRIQEALDSGYEFVKADEVGGVSENVVSRNGDLGEKVRFLVNPRALGNEQYGYLMKIRNEWFEEDQDALQQKNNRIDASIRKGKVMGDNPGFYSPQGGIKIT